MVRSIDDILEAVICPIERAAQVLGQVGAGIISKKWFSA